MAGVEAAGFEVRDQIAWLYSTGMPKSMDISNAINSRLGVVRDDREAEVSNSDGVHGMTRRVLSKDHYQQIALTAETETARRH